MSPPPTLVTGVITGLQKNFLVTKNKFLPTLFSQWCSPASLVRICKQAFFFFHKILTFYVPCEFENEVRVSKHNHFLLLSQWCSHASLITVHQFVLQIYCWQTSFLCLPPLGFGDILFLQGSSVCLSICLSVTKSCPLRNLKTVQDIIMKLHVNINHHWTTCGAQEP